MSPRPLATWAAGLALVMSAATSQASSDPFKKGPYLQNVSQTGVTILWEAESPLPATVTLPGTTPPRVIEAEPAEIQEITIDGLEPGRRYRYVVNVAGHEVEGELATAPRAGAPFSFIVYGDSRSNASAHRAVAERIRSEVPDFLLGTGDMVNDGLSEHDWQRFFDIERELLRENVLFPALGNHDRQGPHRSAQNYRKYFSVPDTGPDDERYYSFSYGNARFLILDSNVYSFALTDQTAWINSELAAARVDPVVDHVFVVMHHPPFSVSLHGGHEALREVWTPLFERYRVDAVFSGHDHVYSRAEHNGVRYFVSGGSGAPLYPRSRRASKIDQRATKFFERVNHYLRIYVVGEFVEVTAVRMDGSVIETVSWGALPQDESSRANLVADMVALAGMRGKGTSKVAMEPASIAVPAGGERFGWLGPAALVAVVCAGGVLVWSLRR